MRKIFLLVACIVLLGALTITAQAAETVDSGTCGADGDNLTWTLDINGTLTISGTGAMGDYDGVNKTNAAPWDTYLEDSIKCIVIEEGVTRIGREAFYVWRDPFESISLPSTLKIIGEDAFYWNGALKVFVPSVQIWCDIFFENWVSTPLSCNGLSELYVDGELITDIVIPYGTTEIGDYQFYNYAAMTSIQIPDTVTRIGSGALGLYYIATGESESKLTSITFPASVTDICMFSPTKETQAALTYRTYLTEIVYLNSECSSGTNLEELMYSQETLCFYGYEGSNVQREINQMNAANNYDFSFFMLDEYGIVSGADSTVRAGSSLTIQVNSDFLDFERVCVDGLVVDPGVFAISTENNSITFKAEFLNTLDEREHNVTLFFSGGTATTKMIIDAGILGDIDSNLEVDSNDVVQLLLHVSMPEIFPLTVSVDFNGDGTVNSDDVVQLLLHVSMPDMFPLQQ